MVSAQVGALKEKSESLEAAATAAEAKLRELMQSVPNLPHDSVPAGKSEQDNFCEKTWGTAEDVRLPCQAALGDRRAAWDSGL